MARRVSSGLRPITLAAMVPGGAARGHSRRWHLRQTPNLSSTFLRSLRSLAVTPLPRYYGRSDSCPSVAWALEVPNACSPRGQVSLIYALGLPAIPSPTICVSSASPRHVTSRRVGPSGHPLVGISGLRLSLAGSPLHADRIEFTLATPTGRRCYGLVVLVPLLSTSHRCDAVTVRYRTVLHRTETDFHRSIFLPSQAH